MTFYIDLIFLVCAGVNFLILQFCTKLLSVQVSRLKTVIGALLSAFLSIQTLVFGVSFILVGVESLIILRLVYGKCSYPELIRRFFVLLGVVLVFGAVMNCFSKAYDTVFLKNDRFYAVLPIFVFFFAVISASAILFVFSFFIKHKKALYRIELTVDDEVIETVALLDTGNRLKEPKNKRPVIIIEQMMIKDEHEKDKIFLKTVGSESHSMDMVYIKKLKLLDENREFEDLYAGIAGHTLSKNGEFHALLHSELAG